MENRAKHKLERASSYNPPYDRPKPICNVDPTFKNTTTISNMAVALDLRTTSVGKHLFHEYDDVYSISTASDIDSQREIREIEDQLKEFRGKLLHSRAAMEGSSCNIPMSASNSPTTDTSDEESTDRYVLLRKENQDIHDQLSILRRDYNKIVLESAFLRKENNSFKERLKEEARSRKKLQKELKNLIKSVDEHPEKNIENKKQKTIAENIQHLLEQLNACREDFFEERKEKEQYRIRNSRLERELEDAKKLIEQQNRKLVLYANYFKNPIASELRLPVSGHSDRRRHSHHREKKYMQKIIKTSHDVISNDKPSDRSLNDVPRSDYKSDHIIEACLSNNTTTCRNVRRESNVSEMINRPDHFNILENNVSRRASVDSHIDEKNGSRYSSVQNYRSPSPSSTRNLHSPLLSSISSAYTISDNGMDIHGKSFTSTTSSQTSTNTLCYPHS